MPHPIDWGGDGRLANRLLFDKDFDSFASIFIGEVKDFALLTAANGGDNFIILATFYIGHETGAHFEADIYQPHWDIDVDFVTARCSYQ